MVYLDYSATAPLKKEVLDAMMPYLTDGFGNASSVYDIGRKSKAAVDEARKTVAEAIGAKVNEIYFNGQIYDAYSKIQDIIVNNCYFLALYLDKC